jgi:hypothetical protein
MRTRSNEQDKLIVSWQKNFSLPSHEHMICLFLNASPKAVGSSRGRLSISWFITHSADHIKSYSTYANLPSDYPRISPTANHGPQNLKQEDLSNSGENHPQDDTEENRS